jgi:hypothetical protein
MLVDNLEDMQLIVNRNKDLSWDGWDVVHHSPSLEAEFSDDGIFKNNKWYKRKIFFLTEIGWKIPDSFGK